MRLAALTFPLLFCLLTGCLWMWETGPNRGPVADPIYRTTVLLGEHTLQVETPCRIRSTLQRETGAAVLAEWQAVGEPEPPDVIKLNECPKRKRDVPDRVADLAREVFKETP